MQSSDHFRTLYLDSPISGSQSSPPLQNKPKQKRKQVAQACVWCRLNRVRCDNHVPCRNCRERNQECRREVRPKPLTLPLALAEIEKLKSQISELENKQHQPGSAKSNNIVKQRGDVTWKASGLENQRISNQNGYSDDAESHDLPERTYSGDGSLNCRGIMTESSSGEPRHFYGLSSLQNLVHNLKTHLYLAYGWIYAAEDLYPKPITLSLSGLSESGTGPYSIRSPEVDVEGVFMGKEQEEECLRLFWQAYHSAIPILDERKFLDHHYSLWHATNRSDQYRDDSALVDVVLAICVQYGMTHLQGHVESAISDNEYDLTDPSNAGRWYFQRSQSLLRGESDKPSVTLLQCQILSIVYLRDASLINLALATAASAVQTAYALGLHMEVTWVSNTLESELLKRLWCMVFALEGKMSMDCGRPFLARMFSSHLPYDSHELASSSPEMFVPSSRLKVTWLTYHVEHVKLIQLSRSVFTKVYDSVAQLLASDPDQKFGQNLELVKQCDQFLTEELTAMKLWLGNLPRELQYDQAVSENTISDDILLANVKQLNLPWLQRQRVMLRLLYHDICISLCRAFVTFPSPNDTLSAPTQSAVECLHHAMAITDIVYQVLQDSDILYGWHRAYQFQWNAALLMVAFAFTDLTSPFIDAIVVRLEHAIFVLDTFGRCFAVARSATDIIRKLYDKLHIASNGHCGSC